MRLQILQPSTQDSGAAQLPARGHDRGIGGPRDDARVGAGGGTSCAGVSCTAHSQEVVTRLSVECINSQGDFEEGDGARLAVAIEGAL